MAKSSAYCLRAEDFQSTFALKIFIKFSKKCFLTKRFEISLFIFLPIQYIWNAVLIAVAFMLARGFRRLSNRLLSLAGLRRVLSPCDAENRRSRYKELSSVVCPSVLRIKRTLLKSLIPPYLGLEHSGRNQSHRTQQPRIWSFRKPRPALPHLIR